MLDHLQHVGTVTEISGSDIVLTVDDRTTAQVSTHQDGLSSIGQLDDLLGFATGTKVLVARVAALRFADESQPRDERVSGPRRRLILQPVGTLCRTPEGIEFNRGSQTLPPLGSHGFALSRDQLRAVLSPVTPGPTSVALGDYQRAPEVKVAADLNSLLSRHVAVLGGTGEGKTNLVAGLVQQIVRSMPKARVIVFDVNGEYSSALSPISTPSSPTRVALTRIGPAADVDDGRSFRIPYYALNRAGLISTLLPSERTQMPALRFAIEQLPFVESDGKAARPVGDSVYTLVDDCRADGAKDALKALGRLRDGKVDRGTTWPHMAALSCLIGEWGSLSKNGKGDAERNAFRYGNVQPLVNRIRGLIDDPQFCDVVDVEGGAPVSGTDLSLASETRRLIDRIFGPAATDPGWSAHILDLHRMPQDLMPFILGSLLDLYAAELFAQGPGASHPTLLVLEEAHHYLRQPTEPAQAATTLAYERLAKEGRKFSLALLVSTQRPSELSPTVLSQCGTWCVFRLSNGHDQAVVADVGNWDRGDARQLRSLARGEAIILGTSVNMPTRVRVPRCVPSPESHDADFASAWLSTRSTPTS